jgi:class 3 adenylate cyclase
MPASARLELPSKPFDWSLLSYPVPLATTPTLAIVLRIGINLGDVAVEGDDIYGDGVNIAARLEGLPSVSDVDQHRISRSAARESSMVAAGWRGD